MISWKKTGSGNYALLVNGLPKSVSTDHPMYNQIDLAIQNDDLERAVGFLDVPEAIRQLSGDHLTFSDGGSKILYMGHV